MLSILFSASQIEGVCWGRVIVVLTPHLELKVSSSSSLSWSRHDQSLTSWLHADAVFLWHGASSCRRSAETAAWLCVCAAWGSVRGSSARIARVSRSAPGPAVIELLLVPCDLQKTQNQHSWREPRWPFLVRIKCEPLGEIQGKVSKSNYEIMSIKVWFLPWPYSVKYPIIDIRLWKMLKYRVKYR